MPDLLPGVPEPDDDDEPADPRLREPGEQGMPGTFIDDPHNMPGQQGEPPPSDDEVE